MGKLSTRVIEANKDKKVLIDGLGLRLVRRANGNRHWVLRIVRDGKEMNAGLGQYPQLNIERARAKAAEYKKSLDNGINPIEARREEKIENQKDRLTLTFEKVALLAIDELTKAHRNKKHKAQWPNTMRDYVFPIIGKKRIDEINHVDVVKCLIPIWLTKHETATRVKQRINNIIDWSVGRGYRSEGIAMGVVDKALPKVNIKQKHFAALPYAKITEFIHELHKSITPSALAIEALILTAVRSGEVRGATWSEIDLENKIWTIPAERMKAGVKHEIPLSDQALQVFEKAKIFYNGTQSDFVFPSIYNGKSLSDSALSKKVKSIAPEVTVHGFRSTFRDWIAEETMFDRDLAEMALAHTIENAVERAYRRGNLLERRRDLMQAWANYCEGKKIDNVINISSKAIK